MGRRLTDELTGAQERVFEACVHFTLLRGYPPTRQELADILGMNPNGVQEHIKLIAKKGALRLDRRKARGICIPGVYEDGRLIVYK